ncbi:hypothetical protein NMD1_00239 [Novosphingobium sp. MD-1]|nr:hypothetical protein NMD1_00239 [Novosphingobium sp. MD-1]
MLASWCRRRSLARHYPALSRVEESNLLARCSPAGIRQH